MQAASRRWWKAADYVCAGCVRRQKRAFHVGQHARQEQSILELLEERGYVNQIAGDRNTLSRLLSTRQMGFYAGIDPTAPSLHLGHLLPLMVLFWLYHHGHHVVSLVGGATARVGDPSGRLTSRAKTAENVHQVNFETMFAQVGKIWDNAVRYGERHGYQQANLGEKELLNNASWLGGLNILDFLKLMGNGMRLGTMLGRDTVRNRMEKGDGMSFSEFTYPLLQGWDWWHMYQHHGIQVQIGGSDQYGNIISGMDGVKYIAQTNAGEREKDWLDQGGRLKEDLQPMGLTVPLLTTASGEKFGKSAGNALWLDRSMTSSFDLYGFLLRSSDEDVARYLRLFTFIPLQQIAATMSEHAADPGKREAQHLLASEVLELVHGREEAIKTREEHRSLRNPSLAALAQQTNMSNGQAELASSASQRAVLPASLVLTTPFSRILYHAGIAPTKSEGARMVAKGGIYVAKAESADESKLTFIQIRDQKPAEVSGFITNGLLVLRIGKWKTRIVEVVEDAVFDERKLEAPGWQEWKAVRPQR
ncbi:Tyrosyl-tRNA synthetase C-terminal domain [Teratosphaeria destructans]|uniref:Tyrosine--tRNA ligase n=1 Tax=Teratosphaeria destructans TaxID=418781 RepID=A0A9W7SZ51_9PEZI|nr:Tyrosyl-tRNA synthetase C-terminal domain [Teratosphaeria destructans]